MARMPGFPQEVLKMRLIEYICRQDVTIDEFTIKNHYTDQIIDGGMITNVDLGTSTVVIEIKRKLDENKQT